MRRDTRRMKDEELNINELFERYRAEVEAKTRYFFKKWGYKVHSYEDLYQTVACIFTYAYKTWKKEKGRFDAHLKSTINRKVIDLLQGIPLPGCSDAPFDILKTEYKSRCELMDFEEENL